MKPLQAGLAALFALCFTASAHDVQDSVGLIQSTKTSCGFCKCVTEAYKAEPEEGMRCLLTSLDHHMLPSRVAAERALTKVNWDITHACADVQHAVSGDTDEEDIIHDFMAPFAEEFDKCATKMGEVKKLMNQFADSVAADLHELSQDHVSTVFDSCMRHSDEDIAKFQGMLRIAKDVFLMTTDADLKLKRVTGFFEAALKFIADFRDTSFKCFEGFSKDFFLWAQTKLPTTPEVENAVALQSLRLGIKYGLLVLQSSEQEIRALHLEIQCLCKKLGKPAPEIHNPMQDPPSGDEVIAPPKLPPEALAKGTPKSTPKRRKSNGFELLFPDLPQIRTMLDRHQLKLLDEVIAMHNGTQAKSWTQAENETQDES